MSLTSNEEYINKLKELSRNAKLALDQAAAIEAGANSLFSTAVVNQSQIKSYSDNIEGTNKTSKPLVSSLSAAEGQVDKVKDNTGHTLIASEVLILSTQKLAQLTEELDQEIRSGLVQRIQQEGSAMEKSPKITSAMETLQASMQSALEAALKAYADSLSFYQEINLFKNVLDASGSQQRGDLRDDIHLLHREIKRTFPLDKPGSEDKYYKDIQDKQLPNANKEVEKKREALEAAQKAKNTAQIEFDAITASLAAAEAANAG